MRLRNAWLPAIVVLCSIAAAGCDHLRSDGMGKGDVAAPEKVVKASVSLLPPSDRYKQDAVAN